MSVKLTSIQACPIKHIWLIAHSVSVTRHSIIDASVFIAAINAWEIYMQIEWEILLKKRIGICIFGKYVLGSTEGTDMLGDKAHPFHMAWKPSDRKRPHSSRCIWQAEIIKGPGFSTKAIWHKVVNPHWPCFNTTAAPSADWQCHFGQMN